MSTLQDRIKQLRGSNPQAKFASQIGVTQSSLGRYERGEGTPDVEFVHAIYSILGVEPKWLIFGEGPMRASDTTTIDRTGVVCAPSTKPELMDADDCQLAMITMVEARLSAGTGSFEAGGDGERRYAFRTDFLSRKGQISQMVLMRVSGDSMEPEIYHNDVVLIDQSQIKPQAGAMFAVAVEDLVYIKMVDALPGRFILKSFNEAYQPLEIDARGDLADGIRIVGKAIWMGRELR